MVDLTKPYNNLPPVPPQTDLLDPAILKKTISVSRELGRLNGQQQSLHNPFLFMRPLMIREAVFSSEIENINTTVAAFFEENIGGQEALKGANKEVNRYNEAVLSVYEKIISGHPLTTNILSEVQSVIEPNKSGIRKLPGTTISNTVTGEVMYTPPEGEALLRDMLQNLEMFVNDSSDGIDPLIKTAVAHYQLEAIHPFYDGNGRVGRVFILLNIIREGLLKYPILFVSEYISKHKSDYYRLLREVTVNNNWTEWILYMLTAIEIQAKATAHKIDQLLNYHREVLEIMQIAKMPIGLDSLLFENPFVSINLIKGRLGISRQTASKYLTVLAGDKCKNTLSLIEGKKEKVYAHERLLDFVKEGSL